ncbi:MULTISPECIES: GIY-YIG nuclease family protein [Cronobacter]|uniref:Bacteriophage T5 Orf172 DNA-binding domain-containing protein n=1 Tax=Cronobacter sakazakii TaxID=28141 RepID=A0AA45BYJ4_CROSK|nr:MULTISPECIES: GIY-YIG nuclease family protein [Cronobacter]EKM0439988.1 GIY-YIG nuclease family protein [Cronobacter turicensis]PUW01560.1 hypothetical protein B7T07_20975 [Cronobacter sakazakii]WRU16760.1 GIY-YIG nuclease family protein [Cronobacter malonaticus]
MAHRFINKAEGGWIYVLMSGTDIYRYKVGKTINHPVERFLQLRTGDPTLALQVAYFVPVLVGFKLRSLENAIHHQLAAAVGRISCYDDTISEWFHGDARNAWLEMDMMFEEFNLTVTDYYQPNQNKIVRFWGADLEAEYPLRFEFINRDNGEIDF